MDSNQKSQFTLHFLPCERPSKTGEKVARRRVDKFIVKSIITFNKLKEVETVSTMESTKITPHPEDNSQ